MESPTGPGGQAPTEATHSHREGGSQADAGAAVSGSRLPAVGGKGLTRNAVGFLSNVSIGVASTTPAASVALVIGLVIATVGLQAPALVLAGFLPMVFIAGAYYYLNRSDPDCGTNFIWGTKALGPWFGWMAGWIIVSSLAILIANLAQLAGSYTFSFLGMSSAAQSSTDSTILAAAWVVAVTIAAYRGIEVSRKVQLPLLILEVLILFAFAVTALAKAGSLSPSVSWFNPFQVSHFGEFVNGFVLVVLLYWGWDTTVSINEESKDARHGPGLAAVVSTVIVLLLFVVPTVGALAFAGPATISKNPSDLFALLGPHVLGSPLDKALDLVIVVSSVIGLIFLPVLGSRTMLSMAHQGALPAVFRRVHPRFKTPHVSTVVFAGVGLAYYVLLTIVSQSFLADSLTALGPIVALYYVANGLSCVVYFRHDLFRTVRGALLAGIGPALATCILIATCIKDVVDLGHRSSSVSGTVWFGIGAPLVICVGILLVGVVLMLTCRWLGPQFFTRRRETGTLTAPSADR